MTTLDGNITPVPRRTGDHAAAAVHAHLRSLILKGAFPPGAQLNQVELAPLLGVSRTPLREAIRMLQEEGLVEAQPQKRARIVGFDPSHLEAVYAQRVLLEGLAATITARTISDEDLEELTALLAAMRQYASERASDEWREVHKRFHLLLIGSAGPHLMRSISNHMDRSEHYRLLHQGTGPRTWATADAEHEAILDAYLLRDGEGAASELAAHLARTALSLIAQLAPSHDPVAIRVALSAYHASAPVTPRNGSADGRGAVGATAA